MINLVFAALVALQNPALATPPDQQPGAVEIFGDWAVGCDNGWACEALSLTSEDWSIGSEASLTVRRAGGQNGYLRIGVRVYDVEGDTLALHIDGRQAATLTDSGDGGRFEIDPAMAPMILPRIAGGRRASLHGPTGESIGDISLTGSAAALRFIDDRQRRAGTRGAAAAIGNRPSATVPEPPAIPVIRAMPVAARHGAVVDSLPADDAMALHNSRGCDGYEEQLGRNDAYVLSDAADLILISCSRGAYNFSDIAYVRRDGELTPARFDHVFAWGDSREIPLLVNVHWDPESFTLSTFAKGRGIGDCGTAESFVWDGAMFRLTERREMNSCRGSAHWITVYRANVEWAQP